MRFVFPLLLLALLISCSVECRHYRPGFYVSGRLSKQAKEHSITPPQRIIGENSLIVQATPVTDPAFEKPVNKTHTTAKRAAVPGTAHIATYEGNRFFSQSSVRLSSPRSYFKKGLDDQEYWHTAILFSSLGAGIILVVWLFLIATGFEITTGFVVALLLLYAGAAFLVAGMALAFWQLLHLLIRRHRAKKAKAMKTTAQANASYIGSLERAWKFISSRTGLFSAQQPAAGNHAIGIVWLLLSFSLLCSALFVVLLLFAVAGTGAALGGVLAALLGLFASLSFIAALMLAACFGISDILKRRRAKRAGKRVLNAIPN